MLTYQVSPVSAPHVETLVWPQRAARSVGSWVLGPSCGLGTGSALGCVRMAVGDVQPGFRWGAGHRCPVCVLRGLYVWEGGQGGGGVSLHGKGGSASMVSGGQKGRVESGI